MPVLTLYNYCRYCLAELFHDEKGETTFEYVMLIVLVAVSAFIASPTITDPVLEVIRGSSSLLEDGMTS